MNKNNLIAPCDSRLTIYKIGDKSIFNIKNSYYRLEDLLRDKPLAEKYRGGYCLIFRLSVDDYHRYCYIDDGVKNTDNFGDVVQIEVGALMIGRIKNYHEDHQFTRGEEKGMFEFGGSTIVLLIEKNRVKIDSEVLKNTREGYETVVKLGMKIGVKKVK